MATILRFECPGCKAELQVDEGLAGRQGKCIHCGQKIVVPKSTEPPPSSTMTAAGDPLPSMMFLSDATPEEMVHSLNDRKLTGVLLLFEPGADGSCDLTKIPEAKIKCIATQDIGRRRFKELAASFGRRFGPKTGPPTPPPQKAASQAAPPQPGPATPPPQQAASSQAPLHETPPSEPLSSAPVEGPASSSAEMSTIGRFSGTAPGPDDPYELKGDPVGMQLNEFRERHARFGSDGRQDLPVCSNQPGFIGRPELHSHVWHQRAKIVNARIDHPQEDNPPTIAGVKTELLLYQFIEEQLYRISAIFATDMFHVVSDALTRKYGKPVRETQRPRGLIWENNVAAIILARGTVHPRTSSTLHIIHKELLALAESRTPTGAEDV